MKNKLSKAIALMLAFGIISSTVVMAENEIKVYIDEKRVDFDVQPIIYEDRTLVPLRAIFEALGAEVTWNQDTRTASAVRGDDTMSITIDTKQLFKNNEAVELDVPAMIINDRTLVPVRAISESFDCNVQWDGQTQSVNITTKPEPTAEPTVSPTVEPTAVPTNMPISTVKPIDVSKIKFTDDDIKLLKNQKEDFRYNMEQSKLPQYILGSGDDVYEELGDPELFTNTVCGYWDGAAISYALYVCLDIETDDTDE